ncbi:MAG: Asp-tRNA(Asn)/Glu-tRNA(Gln) amidotransferase subunit GatA [Oligoflexia bacterium]|nr:Asp-tRNA(Asn)/Glu-tRNA(Gln) amidotransferase subunit GatA [Oligoflexia bacterium]
MTQTLRTIREVHDAFDQKRLSPMELTREYLRAIGASRHNAFLTVCEERALGQAKVAEALLAREGRVPRERLPLLGVPLAIKDNLVIDSIRTTCASRILENYVPPYTATCVARLEAAGAVTLGKTSLDEFAMGGSNENSAFGPVLHPTHPDRVPGGSSGGSATAVGAGLCVAALGSDTGGSIRLPASYCGVVGVKPTYGGVSRYGLVAFASSLDQVGPMANSVEDAALLLEVMGGHDPRDSTSAVAAATPARDALGEPDWRGLRIGVPEEFFVEGLAPEVERATRAALSWFEKEGAKLVPVRLPHAKHSVAVYYLIAVSEASSNLARFDGVRYGTRPSGEERDLAAFYRKARAGFGAEVKRRIILGTFALSSGYAEAYYRRACQVRRLIKDDFDRAFEKVDLIAGPVSPGTAFKLGEKLTDPLRMYLNDIFTIPANLAGLPALSVPNGKDAHGLPIGLQLLAPQFGEARLLGAAHAFEKGRA